MTYSSARIWSPGRRANFEHFELGRGSINFKVFKVASAGQGRHTNFEHVELGMCSINFKVFKVASAGQCRHTNFENFEVGGGPTSLKVFKVEPGPGIRHDTPCRTSPVPEPFKCQAAKIGPAVAGQAFSSPRPHGPHGLSVGLLPQQPRVQLGPLGRTASTLKTLKTQSNREGAELHR